MYKIYADDQIIHDLLKADSGFVCISPQINKELNSQGSMSFIMPPDHPLYDEVEARSTMITAYDDQEEIFRGRVIECTIDFYGQKEVYVEGELAFLCDSVIRPFGFQGSIVEFLQMALDEHNSQVSEERRLQLGDVTVTDPNDYIVRSSETPMTTWDLINSRLLDNLGGYIQIRKSGSTRYLDYLIDFTERAEQEIKFGENLLDIENYATAADVITCLVPYGAEFTEDEEGYTPQPENGFYNGNRVTIESVNGGRDYIENDVGIALYGRVWGTNIWEDVTLPENLLPKAEDYLEANIASAATLTITAIDLHLADVDVDSLHLGQYIHVYSIPHNLSLWMLCSKIKLDLANPDRSEVTLGIGLSTLSSTTGGVVSGRVTVGSVVNAVDGIYSTITAEIADFGTVYADQIYALEISVSNLQAETADIQNLFANYATINDLEVINEHVQNLTADYAEIEILVAEKASIDDLTALQGYIADLQSDVATIKAAYVTYEEVERIIAGYAYITLADVETLLADRAYVTEEQVGVLIAGEIEAVYENVGLIIAADLEAVYANIEVLEADSAAIKNLLAVTEVAGELVSIHLSTDNAVIDSAVIVNAVADTILAELITAGYINTNEITIKSGDDGGITIIGNQMQIVDGQLIFYDENGTVRMQIGQDATGNFTFVLYDETGTGVMIDADGIHASAISDGLIVDSMVADDAGIQGSKLDIESVAQCLTADGSLIVSAAQVTINDTTLAAAYTEIIQQLEGLEGLTSEGLMKITTYFCLWYSDEDAPPFSFDGMTEATCGIAVCGETICGVYSLDDIWTTDRKVAGEDNYLWVCYLGEYIDGHTEWTEPYCVTDGYLREQTETLQTSFTVIQGEIDGRIWQTDIDEAYNALDGKITTVEDQYAELNLTVDGLSVDIGDLSSTVSNNYTILSTQLAEFNVTLDGIEGRITDVQDEVGTYYEEYTAKIGELTVTTEEIKASVTNVESSVTGIQSNIENIEAEIAEMEGIEDFTPYFCLWYSGYDAPPNDEDMTAAICGTAVCGTTVCGVTDGILWQEEQPYTEDDSLYLWVKYKLTFQSGEVSWKGPYCLSDVATRKEVLETWAYIDIVEGSITEEVGQLYTYVDDNVTYVSEQVARLEITTESITTQVADLEVTVADNYTTFSIKVSEIEQTVDSITMRVSSIEGTVDGVVTSMQSLEKEFLEFENLEDFTPYFCLWYSGTVEPPNDISELTAAICGTAVCGLTTCGVTDYSDFWSPDEPAVTDGLYLWVRYCLTFKSHDDEGEEVTWDEWRGPYCLTDDYAREEIRNCYTEIEQLDDRITLTVNNVSESLQSQIEQTAESITMTVNNLSESVNSQIEQLADSITTTVTKVDENYNTLSSEIKQLADSITLTVTGELGSSASITLSANGTSTSGTIDMSAVREAFANDKTAITISSGTITFNSGTIVINSGNFSVTSGGTASMARANIYGTMNIYDSETIGSGTQYGSVGYRSGSDDQGNVTDGVALWESLLDGYNHYFIASEAGVRMQAGPYSFSITDTGALGFVGSPTLRAGSALRSENLDSTDTVSLIYLGTGGTVQVGNTTYPTTLRGSTVTVGGSSSGDVTVGNSTHYLIATSNGVRMQSGSQDIYVMSGQGVITDGSLTVNGSISVSNTITTGGYICVPNGTNYYGLNNAGDRVSLTYIGTTNIVHVANSSYTTQIHGTSITSDVAISDNSDERLKTDITPLDDAYSTAFDSLLPISYRYIRNAEKLHIGFTTQNVQAALTEAGLNPDDYGMVTQTENEDGDTYGALAYSEIIAILVHEVQSLKKKVEAMA